MSRSRLETERAAAEVGRSLRPGDVVCVSGEVGTGKTTFVRAACRALGVTENITSPSFTIGQTYAGTGASVSHLDLFRLETLEGEDPSLLADYLSPRFVPFIEWPRSAQLEIEQERIVLRVSLEHLGGDKRRVRGEGRADLVGSIARAFEQDRVA